MAVTQKSNFPWNHPSTNISSYCIDHCELSYFHALTDFTPVQPDLTEETHEKIALHLPSQATLNYKANIPNSTLLGSSVETQQDFLSHLFFKGHEFYTNHISPLIAKDKLDPVITSSITFSSYYGAVGSLGNSFASKAAVAMGFKVFASVATPFISQFVESFTETQIHNAKYSYHSLRCIFDEDSCIQLKRLSQEVLSQEPTKDLLNNFSQFDYQQYYQDTSDAIDKLSVPGLFYSGILSATASGIKDFIFVETGFAAACQGYFCKNWISYYFKDWIKDELKKEGEKIQQNFASLIEDEHSSATKQSAVINLEEVIDHTTIPGLGSTPAVNTPTPEIAVPFYHYLNPSNLAAVVAEHALS